MAMNSTSPEKAQASVSTAPQLFATFRRLCRQWRRSLLGVAAAIFGHRSRVVKLSVLSDFELMDVGVFCERQRDDADGAG
jgi:hypothetical protein